jgi:hypothetical protein
MMGNELRETQERERMQTLAEVARLDLARHLIRSGTTHLERAAVRAYIRDLIQDDIDRDAQLAVEEGESYAAVARAVGMSRHGARKRYGHLEVVG